MKIKVECYSGYRGEQTPRVFIIGDQSLGIDEIIDQWLSPDHRYFKVRADDGATYILRHDEQQGIWEIHFFEQK